jgi:hypothetical protein
MSNGKMHNVKTGQIGYTLILAFSLQGEGMAHNSSCCIVYQILILSVNYGLLTRGLYYFYNID